MQAFFTQISGLIGLLAGMNLLLRHAPIEKALYIGVSTGFAVYLLLLIGDMAVQRILEMTPDADPAGATDEPNEAQGSRAPKQKEALAS